MCDSESEDNDLPSGGDAISSGDSGLLFHRSNCTLLLRLERKERRENEEADYSDTHGGDDAPCVCACCTGS